MESIRSFDFFRLQFDGDGNLIQGHALDELKQHAQSVGATDAIFIAHGFRNSEEDATSLYTNFLTTFRSQMSGALQPSLAPRKFVVAGVYWPSKPFTEADDMGGSVQAADDEIAGMEAVKQKLEEMKAGSREGRPGSTGRIRRSRPFAAGWQRIGSHRGRRSRPRYAGVRIAG
jgi:hypothetical protein